ncbi:MAG: hypothetical protein DHS20C07_09000 [Methyloligella sp.]|nr:MAG: hypothetical protein DHS20C07_09000 [Methyloligella sp.]
MPYKIATHPRTAKELGHFAKILNGVSNNSVLYLGKVLDCYKFRKMSRNVFFLKHFGNLSKRQLPKERHGY